MILSIHLHFEFLMRVDHPETLKKRINYEKGTQEEYEQ